MKRPTFYEKPKSDSVASHFDDQHVILDSLACTFTGRFPNHFARICNIKKHRLFELLSTVPVILSIRRIFTMINDIMESELEVNSSMAYLSMQVFIKNCISWLTIFILARAWDYQADFWFSSPRSWLPVYPSQGLLCGGTRWKS